MPSNMDNLKKNYFSKGDGEILIEISKQKTKALQKKYMKKKIKTCKHDWRYMYKQWDDYFELDYHWFYCTKCLKIKILDSIWRIKP